MLKRSVATLLILLYISTVSGFALNLHYCFNRLSSVKIDVPAKTCSKSLAENKMKCCKDKHIEIKVKDCHQATASSALQKAFHSLLYQLTIPAFLFPAQGPSLLVIAYRGPPAAVHKTHIFLQNCTFLI